MFRKVELSDKRLFDEYLSQKYHIGSEACFTNAFAWQDGYNIEFDIIDNMLCVRGKLGKGAQYYLMPYGSDNTVSALTKLIETAHADGNKFILKQLSKDDMAFLDKCFTDFFNYTHERDLDDYIYKADKLITLSGKKLHSKRNHLNNFLKLYEHSFEDLTTYNRDDALDFALGRLTDGAESEYERISLNKIFKNFEALGLCGGVLRVDGKIVAVSLGEHLNKDVAVIHVEKADTDYQGAYAAINQMFAERNFGDKVYINREEDMGIEGLRRAKLSYYPEFLLEKYEAMEK